MKKPIKRHAALKPLSREHHHGLLLCWKIRQGMKLNVETERIKQYTDWFKKEYLIPHFEAEEKYVFPVLGNDHTLVKRALSEHRRLKRLFNRKTDVSRALHLIEEELDGHIRFEERTLFNEIQQMASEEQFEEIQKKHEMIKFSDDDWDDQFWETKKRK